MAAPPIPIRRIRRGGQADMLGEWRPWTKELALHAHGYPLTPPGVHKIDGDLPWVFDEMCPSGYFARRFSERLGNLHLPKRRDLWSAQQVLEIVSTHGAHLSGNLIVGEQSFTRWMRFQGTGGTNDEVTSLRAAYPTLINDVLSAPTESSVGGDRPKLLVGTADGTSLIVKFTPPLDDRFGGRWRDLLRVEELSAHTLRAAGIDAVKSRYVEVEDRGYLEIERFDRVKAMNSLAGGGRIGHVTLFNLGIALYGEASNPEVVIAELVRDGHLPAEDAERFARQHAFSKAIANTDTHLGNYGLLIDDDGNARLSPAYDVLPMAFAPKHDELPDRLVKHTGPRDAATDELVQRLIAAVEADQGISAEFREAWLRAVR